MANCGACNTISDYMIDSIMCSGNCRRVFHVLCIDAPFSCIKLFAKRKSFFYFCDECDPISEKNIVRDVIKNIKDLEKLEKQFTFLSKKVDNLTCTNGNIENKINKDKTSDLGSKTKTLTKRKNDDLDDENSDICHLPKKVATSVFKDFAISRPVANFNSNNNVPASLSVSSLTLPLISSPNVVNVSPSNSTSQLNVDSSTSTLSKNIFLPKITNETTSLTSPIVSGLKAVEGQKILFISKLAPSTNALDIKNHLSEKLGSPFTLNVEKILHRNHTKYSSFKIRAPDSIFHVLNSPSFWPKGVIVHEFMNKSNNPFRQYRTTLNHRQSSLKRY